MTLHAYVKTIFWVGTLLILAPPCITFIKEQYRDFITPRHAIGVLSIDIPITTAQPFMQHCNSFFKDKNIKGVILCIESNGGATGSSQMIFHEIEFLKKEYPKPLIALIENNCTAQAYLIASAASTIIASGAALIGGIKNSATEVDEKINEDIYNQLITAIAHKRKLSIKDHLIWANNQFFTGNQALKLHLIDKIGSFSDALNFIKEKALIDGEIKLLYPAKSGCLRECVNNFIQKLV